MPRNFKFVKLPPALHERAVSLDRAVVARFGPPPNYRRGGPGAAVHAGIALLEAVLNGEQRIVPASDMEQYEAINRAAGLLRMKAALLSTMTFTVAMRLAHAEGADDVDARASEIAAETIRTFVELEIMEAESEAAPETAEALRQIAQSFLNDAERLSARARAATSKEVSQ